MRILFCYFKLRVTKIVFSTSVCKGGAKKKYQAREKSQGRTDFSKTKCYYCKNMKHIQMVCKEMKKDLKRMNDLRGGRRDDEHSGEGTLGFVEDDGDYDGALLVTGK